MNLPGRGVRRSQSHPQAELLRMKEAMGQNAVKALEAQERRGPVKTQARVKEPSERMRISVRKKEVRARTAWERSLTPAVS